LGFIVIFARERVLEIGNEAMERLVELVEERHAALGRRAVLLRVLQRFVVLEVFDEGLRVFVGN
jgi:hypothetical protein